MGLRIQAGRAVNKIYNIIKGRDSFSQQITFTYKGDASFTTFLGGVVSTIILVVMIIYAYSLAQVMFYRKGTNKSLSTTVVDLTSNPTIHYPGKIY